MTEGPGVPEPQIQNPRKLPQTFIDASSIFKWKVGTHTHTHRVVAAPRSARHIKVNMHTYAHARTHL